MVELKKKVVFRASLSLDRSIVEKSKKMKTNRNSLDDDDEEEYNNNWGKLRTSVDFKSFTVSFTGPVISDTENEAETTWCLLRVIEIAGARWCRCLLLHWAAKGLAWC